MINLNPVSVYSNFDLCLPAITAECKSVIDDVMKSFTAVSKFQEKVNLVIYYIYDVLVCN